MSANGLNDLIALLLDPALAGIHFFWYVMFLLVVIIAYTCLHCSHGVSEDTAIVYIVSSFALTWMKLFSYIIKNNELSMTIIIIRSINSAFARFLFNHPIVFGS